MLVDTNTLLRTLQPLHPQREIARGAIKALTARGHELQLVPQNLMELWVVATRPVAQNGLGMSIPRATSELRRLKSMFALLPDYACDLSGLGEPGHSVSGFREAGARRPAGGRHAGAWAHQRCYLRQDWIFPLCRY